MNVPLESMERFTEFIDTLVSRIKKGNAVVVHCKAGKGRTGNIPNPILFPMIRLRFFSLLMRFSKLFRR